MGPKTLATVFVAMSTTLFVSAVALPANPTLVTTTTGATTTTAGTTTARWVPTVSTITNTIPTADASALSALPSTLAPDVKSFLHEFQNISTAAAANATTSDLDNFPNEGLCTETFPCFSVSNVSLGNLKPGFKFTIPRMTEMLKKIQSQGLQTDQSQGSNSKPNEHTLKTSSLELHVSPVHGEAVLNTTILAGSMFDLFKAQGFQNTFNAVRGVGVGGGPQGDSLVNICISPIGGEKDFVKEFCHHQPLTLTSAVSGKPPGATSS